ncbi:universal stress protein [Desulfospira joergensenii]|uniref:universal stress protein n=1 Tax=Desulfospira joergensenii TaxID=53329 RepID=UPI0003B46E62|nr:universal stress protein [Desulfospira joergensenii]
MNTENILVPVCRHSSDLKALYHSFALAERVRAKIFVLFFTEAGTAPDQPAPIENACLRIVKNACEEGIPVSFHLAEGQLKTELSNFIAAEHIGLIVISPGDEPMESVLRSMKPKITAQVIKVEKRITY